MRCSSEGAGTDAMDKSVNTTESSIQLHKLGTYDLDDIGAGERHGD